MIDSFYQLLECDSEDSWRTLVFELAGEYGYPYVLLAIFPKVGAPWKSGLAYLHSNYPKPLQAIYDNDEAWQMDPTVNHCATKTTPLVWCSQTFSDVKKSKVYEVACQHGIRAGVSLPMRGTQGEFGVLCFATNAPSNATFHRNATNSLPMLSCLRDFVLETALHYMRRKPAPPQTDAYATSREIECLNWIAAGKTSWEVAQILRCSEATVNFHVKNLRRKFNVTSRQQAIVKAIHLGLLPEHR